MEGFQQRIEKIQDIFEVPIQVKELYTTINFLFILYLNAEKNNCVCRKIMHSSLYFSSGPNMHVFEAFRKRKLNWG